MTGLALSSWKCANFACPCLAGRALAACWRLRWGMTLPRGTSSAWASLSPLLAFSVFRSVWDGVDIEDEPACIDFDVPHGIDRAHRADDVGICKQRHDVDIRIYHHEALSEKLAGDIFTLLAFFVDQSSAMSTNSDCGSDDDFVLRFLVSTAADSSGTVTLP